jgi:hypothetical protein
MAETPQINYKEIIKAEYVKCANDPVYFMKKYVWIQHPTRGRVQFNLYPFQEKVLHLFKNNDYSMVLKSRQLGISTLVAGYTLWIMLFQKDKNVLCIATKQDTAKNMVTKVRFAWENLPTWLKLKDVENNKLSLKLKNGSQVKAVSASGDAGRSEAVSLLIIDEAAFIESIDEIFASAQQTLATGGGCIALSTPFGTGNWFHKTWVKAETGENKFLPIKLPWTVHPERDEFWRKEQDDLLGPRMAAQECDAEFMSSGETVFEPDFIKFMEDSYIKEPMERRGVEGNLWIWEQADYTKSYIVVADVARGDGADYSAFHIIDIENACQVGEYKGHISTKDYGNVLVSIATEYNDALLVVENANIGWAVIQQIQERGYQNMYHSPRADNANSSFETYINKYQDESNLVAGFTTSLKTRPLVVSTLISYINEKSFTFQSRRLLEELKVFVWKNGKGIAQNGYNDDLIMSLGIALYLRDTAFKFRQQGMDLTRVALNNFRKVTTYSGVYSSNNVRSNDQWNMQDSRGNKENLNWLL